MGESKNGAKTQIKRNIGMWKAAAANADHSTAQETATRGHRSAAAPRAWRSQYTDTHKPEPDRQSAKDAPQLTQEPERIRKRYAFLRERLRTDASRPACRHICEGVARYHLNIDVSGAH